MSFVDVKIPDLNPSMTVFPLQILPGVAIEAAADSAARPLTEIVTWNKLGKARKDVDPDSIQVLPPNAVGNWRLTGIIYKSVSPPAWLNIDRDENRGDEEEGASAGTALELTQEYWHLALLGLSGGGLGRAVVHATQDSVADAMREWLLTGRFGDTFLSEPLARPFPDRALQAACLSGRGRHSSLSGLHRSVTTKADAKSLSGLDLRDAIDPFGDQTYRLTSAISQNDARQPKTLGLAVQAHRVWSRKGKTIDEFADNLDHIFNGIETGMAAPGAGAGMNQHGYDSLARPLEVRELEDARGAFEISFRPLTELVETDRRGSDLEMQWFDDGHLVFREAEGRRGLAIDVYRNDRHLMVLRVSPESDGETISLSYRAEPSLPETDPDVELFETLLEDGPLSERLAIMYETGHVVFNGEISLLRYRDVLFDKWKWMSFRNPVQDYVITQEKPQKPSATPGKWVADLSAIGDQRSLFCHFLHHAEHMLDEALGPVERDGDAPLWIVCDDGSGEIADFIVVDQARRALWLVHAKGADSASAGRKLSAAPYEIVVSQAVKNLRFLDTQLLAEELTKRREGRPILWINGKRIGAGHAAALKRLTGFLRACPFMNHTMILVLQPHVAEAQWLSAKEAVAAGVRDTIEVKTYRLLCTLLAELQINAQKVGADLGVIGVAASDQPPATSAAKALAPGTSKRAAA